MGIGLLALLSPAWAADCGDASASLAKAEQAVWEGRLDDADAALRGTEEAWGCSAADSAALARFWLAEGASLTWAGETDAATQSFAASKRVGAAWNANYGSKIKQPFDGASDPEETGSVTLDPPLLRTPTWLDGTQVAFPVTATAGLHLIQVGAADAIGFGRVVELAPGQSLSIGHGVADAPEPEPEPEPEPIVEAEPEPVATTTPEPVMLDAPKDTEFPQWLVVGGLAAALGTGAAIAARSQRGALNDAKDLDELDAAWKRQQAFGWTAYALGGVAGVSVALHFAL